MAFVLLTYFKWGPTFTSDTLGYYGMSMKVLAGEYPHSPSLSPAYPALAALVSASFGIPLHEAGFFISAGLYVVAATTIFLLISALVEPENGSYVVFIIALLILNAWWSVRILFNAHADGLFYLLHLAVFYAVVLYLKSGRTFIFVIACLVAALSIWAKSNAMILVIYLAVVPAIYYGFERKALIGLIAMILGVTSLLSFRVINGPMIENLTTGGEAIAFWGKELSAETLRTNLIDSGNTLVSGIATDKVAALIPPDILLWISPAIILGIAVYGATMFGKRNLTSSLLVYVAMYVVSLALLYQTREIIEMNQRTLFPAIFVLIVVVVHYAFKKQSAIACLVFVIFAVTQPIRTTTGTMQWYLRAPMDSFVYASEFGKRDSLKVLRGVMSKLGLGPNEIYTNQKRYLTIYFNYESVRTVPLEIGFSRGKMLPREAAELDRMGQEMVSEVKRGDALIVLFDGAIGQLPWVHVDSGLRVEVIGPDIIVYAP